MFKRSRQNNDDGSYPYQPDPYIYGMPPLESTIVFDSQPAGSGEIGGLPNRGVGYNDTIPIGTSIRGCKSLQYSSTNWQNDFFTHSYSNNLIGLIVTYAWTDTSVGTSITYTTAILPLFLARGKRTVSISDSGQTLSYSDKSNIGNSQQKIIGDNLAYELNLRFAGTAATTGWPNDLTNTWGLTSNGILDFYNNQNMPLWVSAATSTRFANGTVPILFAQTPSATGNGGQLSVFQNFNAVRVDPTHYGFNIFMNFVSIRPYMVAPYFQKEVRLAATFAGLSFIAYPRAVAYGVKKGGLSQGAHVFGAGNWNAFSHNYEDDYTTDDAATVFSFADGVPHITNNPSSFYSTLISRYLLKVNFLVAPRCLGFCPSRYYLFVSEAICRNQKINFITNSGSLGNASATVAVFYADFINKIPPNQVQEINLNTGNAVVGMSGHESRDTLDWKILDEWGDFMQTLDYANPYQNLYLSVLEQNQNHQPNEATVPAYFKTLNPLPTVNSTGQPLCGFENCNSNGFMCTTNPAGIVEAVPFNNPLDSSFYYDYKYPTASKMTNFIRVLGRLQ